MRYLGSFFITLVLYASAITTLFYTMNSSFSSNTKKEIKEEIVKISLVETPVKEIKKELKKEEKKVIEKEKEEEIKKTEKPKIKQKTEKPKIKKEKIKKEEIKKEVKKEVIKTQEKTLKQPTVSEKPLQNIEKPVTKIDTTFIKEQFFSLVKNKIDSNKEYPNSARRRGIEGSIKVKFQITKEGNVKDISILSGKKIFHKAVLNAINNSFPIKIPKELNSFPLYINLELKFNLN